MVAAFIMFGSVGGVARRSDPGLMLLAVMVCLVVSGLACALVGKARDSGRARPLWIIAAAIAAGSGFWATQFIALLGFHAGAPLRYDPGLVLAAWVLAMLGDGAGFSLVAVARKWPNRLTGGVMLGLTGVVTHDMAMAAIRPPGLMHCDIPTLVVTSVLGMAIAVAASAAMVDLNRPRSRLAAAFGLTGSTVCLHLVGLAALHITTVPHASIILGTLGPVGTAVSVAVALGLAVSMSMLVICIHVRSDQDSLIRLREVFEALPAAVACFDANDQMVLWNARYARAIAPARPAGSGVSYAELIAASVAAGFYSEAVGDEAGWIARHMAARRSFSENRAFEVKRNGSWTKFDERRTADGGLICVGADINALKISNELTVEALTRAERADRAKSDFLSNISHELHTPLNGVLGLSDALAASGVTPAQRRMVDALHASAQTLTGLIRSILELSELQDGAAAAMAQAFDPAALVRDTADLFRSAAMAKGLTLSVEVPEYEPGQVVGDPGRLRQVLINLLSNAVKFTEQGGVHLSLRLESKQSGRVRLRLAVADTGTGFDDADAERLFSQFEQGDSSLTRRHGGAGIGLATSRQVVALLGGELVARSRPGCGATFSFDLDLPRGEDAPRAGPEPYAPVDRAGPAGEPLRVLLADDHPTNRQVVELILKATESDLTLVENGAEALAAFRRTRYDLVLMDLQMPVMDGLTAIRLIREFEHTTHLPRTPLIALTANVLTEHVVASMAAGADRHVGKPITAARLLDEIARLFELEPTDADLSDAA